MKVRHLFILLGTALGAGGGMAYWYAKHCFTGNCTPNTIFALDLFYGALLGIFLSYFLSLRLLGKNV